MFLLNSLKKKAYFFIWILALTFSVSYFYAFATPPVSPYTPGETIDPSCSPGDANCYVTPMSMGDVVGGGTAGSVVFINSDGELDQDNAAFFWDQSTDRLGIGDNTPQAALTVGSGDLFRVTSAGGVTATGVTSSGSIVFSGLSTGVVLSSSGTLSSSLGTANQFLGVNSAGTANEYKTFATSTSGTDFNIAHSSGTITFNLPTASSTSRGALSSADWTTFNSKADDFLDLSDTPDSYTSKTNKIVSVNTGATGLGFGPDVLEDSGNFRLGSNTSFGAIYNTVVGTGNRMGVASSRNTLIGYNINNAGNSYGENTIIGPAELAVNADTMTIVGSVVNHARIAGMVALGSYFTLPTSGVYSSQTSNSPIYIGYNINNSETAASTKGNIFIGRNISTAGFTSNATTKAIVIAQDPTLENGMQNSVVIGADTSVLDEESNVTVIGSGAMAYLDSTYGNGGGDGVAIGRSSKTGSWRAMALGAYAQALAVSSNAIGYGAYTNSSHGIAIGRGSYNDVDNSVVIQPSASTGDTNLGIVYFGAVGSYWTNPAMPSTETIDLSTTLSAGTVVSRITGVSGRDTRDTPLLTDIRGGHLRILGGQSTGTAEGGDIQFAVTPAGGVSNNTLNSEFVAGAFKSDKKFYLYDTPDNDDDLTQVLVRNGSTGEIMYKSASSFDYFTGSVGIGTDTTPDFLLEVENNAVDTNIFSLKDSDGQCDMNPEAGALTTTCSSDEKLKENITDSGEILSYLSGFRIREYDVKSSGDHMTGVIAQEVMDDYPELVKMGNNGFYTVELPSTWQLVKGIQELDIKIQDITSLDLENENSFANILISWFDNVGNGIQNIFSKKVTTEELCIEDVCITKEDLQNILDQNGYVNTGDENGGNDENLTDEGSDTPEEEPQPESDIPEQEPDNTDPGLEEENPITENTDEDEGDIQNIDPIVSDNGLVE